MAAVLDAVFWVLPQLTTDNNNGFQPFACYPA
jgi:hypothetical protein